jgi:hypothetical protein
MHPGRPGLRSVRQQQHVTQQPSRWRGCTRKPPPALHFASRPQQRLNQLPNHPKRHSRSNSRARAERTTSPARAGCIAASPNNAVLPRLASASNLTARHDRFARRLPRHPPRQAPARAQAQTPRPSRRCRARHGSLRCALYRATATKKVGWVPDAKLPALAENLSRNPGVGDVGAGG